MTATRGRVVQTPGAKEPYKVILEYEVGQDIEEAVRTVREGEDLIKEETPAPQKRDTSRDRPAPHA